MLVVYTPEIPDLIVEGTCVGRAVFTIPDGKPVERSGGALPSPMVKLVFDTYACLVQQRRYGVISMWRVHT